MQNQKALEFHGTAGGYFLVTLVSMICAYIPLFGWAFAFNFTSNWATDNMRVNGQKVTYTASYLETLKLLFVNLLLIIVTFGIYLFWFGPKLIRYQYDHTEYVPDAPVVMEQAYTPPTQAPDQTQPVNSPYQAQQYAQPQQFTEPQSYQVQPTTDPATPPSQNVQ